MATAQIYETETFFAPRFEIRLGGSPLSQTVVRDVTAVSYTDSLDQLEFFEFTLHDWDPVQRTPKYSSPYDESGAARPDSARFEPGDVVELAMGYYGPADPVTMLRGQIVTVTPSFPASGLPTFKVRALSQLFGLQNSQVSRSYENTPDTDIAKALAGDLGNAVATPVGQATRETPHEFLMIDNQYPIVFLMGRARRLGYDVTVLANTEGRTDLEVTGGGRDEPAILFGPASSQRPTYALEWGKTLIEANLTVRIKDQVGSVTVRGFNMRESGGRQQIEATATLADLDLDLPDPRLLDAIDGALAKTEEVVVDDPIENQQEADLKALGTLRERIKDLVTIQGKTVGFPGLRAGGAVEITGIGPRYSGRYVLTGTTHRVDASSGYITEFSARLEGRIP